MKLFKIYFFFFFISFMYSQNETNNWHFGNNASLNFSSSPPAALTDSRINTTYGSASISDENGILQFYTNSLVIFNRNHSGMLNSSLNNGTIDADQNSIIIKKPNSSDQYYLFTIKTKTVSIIPELPAPLPGLYYTEIDMSGDNGLGVVVNQNMHLLSSEVSKISAVHHKDGKSIWLLTTVRDEGDEFFTSFYAFKINENSTIEPPIISSNNLNLESSFDGIMKFSPNGQYIAMTDYENPMKLYSFDPETGEVVSSQGLINTFTFFEVIRFYGIAFSNNSNFLYATAINEREFSGEVLDTERTFIYQYNLQIASPFEQLIITEDDEITPPTALQLAKDGKIYRTIVDEDLNGTNFLGVVDTPNIFEEFNYIDNYLDLNSKRGKVGLPNFVQSYFRTRIISDSGCATNPMTFEVDTYTNILEIEWDFGDGSTINEIRPDHVYAESGNYTVNASIRLDNGNTISTSKDIIIYEEPKLISNQKLNQCDSDTDGISIFNLNNINHLVSTNSDNEEFIFYETLSDAENNSNEIINPENYTNTTPNQEVFVRVINENDCYTITSFFIEANYVNIGNISNVYVCEDSDDTVGDNNGYFNFKPKTESIKQELSFSETTILRYYPTLLDAQKITNEIQAPFISPSTTIWLRVDTELGCGGIQSFDVVVNSTPFINLEETYTICIDPSIQQKNLEADSTNDRYEWKNSENNIVSTNRIFELNTIGQFSLTVHKTENNIECSNTHNFNVINPEAPILRTIDLISDGKSNTIYVDVNGNSTYEFSLDGENFQGNSTSFTFENVLSGIQTVFVRDTNECEPSINTEISIIGYPNFFTPNNDGINDTWFLFGVDLNHFSSIDVTIFNRFGKLLYVINNENYTQGWNGVTNGKNLPESSYWFFAKLVDLDGNHLEKKGNISLIR